MGEKRAKMELDSQAWIEDYERLKNDFQRERKTSGSIGVEEIKNMIDRITTLEKELNIMKDSPMQYDLYVTIVSIESMLT